MVIWHDHRIMVGNQYVISTNYCTNRGPTGQFELLNRVSYYL